ncbi:RNA-binding transcriptional accessory protein [Aerococcus urinaehominis]|uniref:RNA-binding transcriptional accessory protein n=1 Tax=Aerococcus urinaehominis TaxID=128944 RepID=A0A0X8FMI3_9LACT|nr:Tex family protein [Aerococcus urinaehominis]AMC00021.1 RNA-binding transcriptional accessory protein [Aerococcus urinaehominis]
MERLPDYQAKQVTNVLDMLAEGNTVPFIARYRKEQTGSLDEVQIREIEESYQYVSHLEDRRETIIKAIKEQDKLTPALEKKIKAADQLTKLEDLYAPYKQKRRTKATVAKEAGLEPLASLIFSNPARLDIESEANQYLNEEIKNTDEALAGAHEIMAEWVSEDADIRAQLRETMSRFGLLTSRKIKNDHDQQGVYEVYYDFSSPVPKVKSYQVLALNRAEKEKVLKVDIEIDKDLVSRYIQARYIKHKDSPTAELIQHAIDDALARFLLPAIIREIRSDLTSQAEDHAIETFNDNLSHLLMQPPMKGQTVMGWDPAFRTGCKLAIVDATGKVLAKDVIYPHKPVNKKEEASEAFRKLIADYGVETIAIGNGTASRESEAFVADQIKAYDLPIHFVIVNESGASVYSASEIAREEFPDYNVEERSAVSIAHRLQDPLAELVKIEPQAIGVGQYQHDIAPKKLADNLDFTVDVIVNRVGVNVNTASPSLLEHVAGLTKAVAKNITNYREEHGIYTNRKQLLDVPRLGPKAYEQSAGFLRVVNGDNILDNTGIHPESYQVTERMLADQGIDINNLASQTNQEKLKALDPDQLSEDYNLGAETWTDILEGLLAPGRDLRDDIEAPVLRSDVLEMKDLKPGMALQGTVRNVVDFGAFVDIGVKEDGLVHISRLSQDFVKNPKDVVSLGDIVTVWVQDVDLAKNRISLSMVGPDKDGNIK